MSTSPKVPTSQPTPASQPTPKEKSSIWSRIQEGLTDFFEFICCIQTITLAF